MVRQIRSIITEEESNRVKSLYGLGNKNRDYIFELCTTVDGRYFILKDEVFDIQEQKLLGNLWSSIDIFKNIFTNVKISDDTGEYNQIKENIISLPITESKKSLYELRDILLEWSFWEDTWLGEKMVDSGKAIQDTVTAGVEGLKQFGVTISKGEWGEILNALAKGVKWVLRKLKEAMYSTIGMIVDAILVVSGIGKSVQWIPWALITALDVYQLSTGDWPEEEKDDSLAMKFLVLGFDILGLVAAGAMAKTAKTAFEPLKTMKPSQISSYIEKNPKLKSIVQTIIDSIGKVPKFLSSARASISSKFPAAAKFLGEAISMFSRIMSSMKTSLEKMIGVRATKMATTGTQTGGLLYGFETGAKKYTQYKTGFSDVQMKNLETLDGLAKKYGGKDPFD